MWEVLERFSRRLKEHNITLSDQSEQGINELISFIIPKTLQLAKAFKWKLFGGLLEAIWILKPDGRGVGGTLENMPAVEGGLYCFDCCIVSS